MARELARLHERDSTLVSSRVEVREGLPALRALRDDWAALCRRSQRATVFQWPEWMIPLCEHVERLTPVAALLLRGGALEGLLLTLVRDGELRLCGEGPTDRLDVILASPSPTAAEALLEPLLARVDRARLDCLSPGSPLLAVQPRGFRTRVEDAGPTPVLQLSRERPRGVQKELAYLRRRAAREGGLTSQDDGDVDERLRILFALHERRWRARGTSGVLQGLWSLHRDVAQGLQREGLLRLRILRVGGAPVSATYGFSAHGRAAYYLGGFDPSFKALSPGTLAVGAAVEHATSEQACELDFLRGAEPYKYAWGAEDRPLFRLVLERDSLAG